MVAMNDGDREARARCPGLAYSWMGRLDGKNRETDRETKPLASRS